MFSLNETVVYPGYGVARISRIIVKKVGSGSANFFELTFLSKPIVILVPVANAVAVGIRAVSSIEKLDELFNNIEPFTLPICTTHAIDANTINWNKRNKEYQGKMRTGDLREIYEIYRDLKIIEHGKGLSFGEKTLLAQTENLLVEEIAIVYAIDQTAAIEKLRLCTNELLTNVIQNKLRSSPARRSSPQG